MASALSVKMDRPYFTSSPDIDGKWRWRPVPDGQYWEPSMVNVARMLGDCERFIVSAQRTAWPARTNLRTSSGVL